jgi:FUN14 domain-containing protein 1
MVFQVAQHFGYIEINWKKFQKDFDKQKKRTIKAINANTDGEKLDRLVNETKSFITQNVSFALSFLGGTLVGISF